MFLLEIGRQNEEIMEYFSFILCEHVEDVPEHSNFHVIFQLIQGFYAVKLCYVFVDYS